ncbi:hypothetical protein EJ03DRAFT_377210 [Teratosphaeria nubilosa]|uniref:Uncharacterized protein n=1 Tax=Teratosphaeria nubilosa TaxID=161662 RepID=A0A6G1KZT7_9PEZI|nr:hypothetical protein EJ03DRAFT_377210 [Teratosphaeria nubilosa]
MGDSQTEGIRGPVGSSLEYPYKSMIGTDWPGKGAPTVKTTKLRLSHLRNGPSRTSKHSPDSPDIRGNSGTMHIDIIAVTDLVIAAKKEAESSAVDNSKVKSAVADHGPATNDDVLPNRPRIKKRKQDEHKERDERERTPVFAPKYGSKPAGKNWVRNHKRSKTAFTAQRAHNSHEAELRQGSDHEVSSVEGSLLDAGE